MNRVIDVNLINPYNNCILGNIIFLQYLFISIGLVDQMESCFYRLRCEVFQNLILRIMNTGFVRPDVATVLTVYGIETYHIIFFGELVLIVATVLTVYGIETSDSSIHLLPIVNVATVLTVYGIETFSWCQTIFNSFQLQQYLPFTVLKRFSRINKKIYI